jgi:hypothetical protein
MTPPVLATDGSVDSPAEEPAVVASLQALRDRVESMAEVIDALRPLVTLAQQAPAMAAMVGDSFDDVMRIVLESGIDVPEQLTACARFDLRRNRLRAITVTVPARNLLADAAGAAKTG